MNRVGTFDLLVNDDDLLGTRAWIWIKQWSSPNLIGAEHLTTITSEAASFGELKAQVDLLKEDLDEVLRKARQHFAS
jgi:hypothetical protein